MIEVTAKTPTSIYIHIPFCVKKCPYCDFNSYGVGSDEPLLAQAYIDAVCRELEFYLKNHWEGRELCSIFFGGGTPSLLSADKLGSVLNVIQSSIPVRPEVEVTVEANPGTVQEELGLEKLIQLKELGFNRISFGSQSFSKKKLEFLGRLHTPENIVSAVSNARAAGFTRLNLDLIFGVKGETLTEYSHDLSETLALSPEHISAYSLTIEPGTDFGKLEKKGLKLAEEDDIQANFFEATSQTLLANSFTQYEVSNYAKSGEECRHNLHYWRRGNYLGIGAGAHGFLSDGAAIWGRRWFNIPKPEHYIDRVKQLSIGHHAQEVLDIEQAKTEFISLAIRTREGISLDLYKNLFIESFQDEFAKAIKWGTDYQLLEVSKNSVKVTTRGFIMVNSIVERFL